jgi:hypothetical protein
LIRAILAGLLAAIAAGSATAAFLRVRRVLQTWRSMRRMERARESLTRELRAEWARTAEARSPEELITPERARAAVRGLLEEYRYGAAGAGFDERGILLPPPVRASYDPVMKRIHAEIPIDGETLGRMAERSYADGLSHAEVTAYLESAVPGFRRYLVEAVCLDGALRWIWLGPELRRKRPA